MNQQKFYIIFIICLLALGAFSLKLIDLPNFLKETHEVTAFQEAELTKPKNKISDTTVEETEKNNTIDEKIASDNKNQTAPQKDFSIYGENIKVNKPSEFTGKTKKEIYSIRKKYVSESIFAREKYEPSDEVFGQIQDYKPWIGVDVCVMPDSNLNTTKGPSEESRFINNPTMLVAIEFPFSFPRPKDESWCTETETTLMPRSIYYSAQKKEITVVYNWLPFTTKGNSSFYMFNGVNARDLGYKYAYVDLNKSTYKPEFTSNSNIGNSVQEFQNFIHLGGSCGIAGGCNNGSPRMSYLEFRDDFTTYKKTYKEIYIKLWKNRPASPEDESDIAERIIIVWTSAS